MSRGSTRKSREETWVGREQRAIPRRSIELEVRARSAYHANIPFQGTSGFWFLKQTKHENELQAWNGPVTFYLVTQTKYTLKAKPN